jgi:hypothetical protein
MLKGRVEDMNGEEQLCYPSTVSKCGKLVKPQYMLMVDHRFVGHSRA